MTRSRGTLTLLFGVMVATASLACSSDSSTSTPTTVSATCDDLQEVRDQVQALQDLDVVADGTDALRSSLDELGSSVSDLAGSASGDLETEADTLRASVEELSTVVDGAGDQPVTSTVSQISQQLQTIGSDLGALLESADDELSNCDTSTSGS
jgi:hypothetical protein